MADADAEDWALISIHAPPRGATCGAMQTYCCDIFQFTPLREGRQKVREREGRGDEYFNSRPSARGDDGWGAVLADWRHFNSRPSARGDLSSRAGVLRRNDFNSRPSARGDDACDSLQNRPIHFNSRPSARGDKLNPMILPEEIISIHAPPRGATI